MNAPDVPFLTELDSRAEVKGSRDPLALSGARVRALRTLADIMGSLPHI